MNFARVFRSRPRRRPRPRFCQLGQRRTAGKESNTRRFTKYREELLSEAEDSDSTELAEVLPGVASGLLVANPVDQRSREDEGRGRFGCGCTPREGQCRLILVWLPVAARVPSCAAMHRPGVHKPLQIFHERSHLSS
jgi:hypothetical protein